MRDVLQLNTGVGLSRTVKGLNVILADIPHNLVFKGSAESAALPFHGPFTYGFVDQETKQSIVCNRNGAPKARLRGIIFFLVCQVVRLLQQIIRKRHRSGPRRFVEFGLFRLASEIEVREKSEAGEVEPIGHAPYYLCCHIAKMVSVACFIGEQHAEEDRPLAAPVLRDLIVDTLHRG